MPRCSACDYPLPDDRERLGARCPHCFAPLYEAARFPRPARAGDRGCVNHPTSEPVGACTRCQARLCEVCRTRWNEMVTCPACVQRALEARQREAEARNHPGGEVKYSLLLGAAAWGVGLLSVLGAWLLGAWRGPGEVSSGLLLLLLALFMLGGLAALTGVALAVSVLRRRERPSPLAKLGLALGGVYVAFLLGVCTLGVWSY